MEFRTGFGELNSFVLDSLRGLDETIQYRQGQKQKDLSHMEGSQRSVTNMVILLASFGMLFLTLFLYRQNAIGFDGVLICTISMMGSFGPVVALSSLSNNLNQTLASGERVLSILEEKPQVEEISGEETIRFDKARAEHVDFAYDQVQILKNYSMEIPKGKIIGIHGASGSGKSTLLKLLMRFWDVQGGRISISDRDIIMLSELYISPP